MGSFFYSRDFLGGQTPTRRRVIAGGGSEVMMINKIITWQLETHGFSFLYSERVSELKILLLGYI